jgi:hypothetical protein
MKLFSFGKRAKSGNRVEPGIGAGISGGSMVGGLSTAPIAQMGSDASASLINGTWFVSSLESLNQVLDREKRPKLVLRGDLVLTSLKSDLDVGERYVRQIPRVSAPSLGSILKSDANDTVVSVWLLKDAVDSLFANRINAVALEIDQLLQFSPSKKGKKILITAWKENYNMPVLAIVMKDGVVERILEKGLKVRDFEVDLKQLVMDMRTEYPAYEMTWVSPEGEFPSFLPAGIENAGAAPFARLSAKPLLGQGQKITFLQKYGAAAGIMVAGVVAYILMIGWPYQAYSDLRAKSQEILQGFKSDSEFTTSQLGILQARRFYISDVRPQTRQTKLLQDTIMGINKLPVRTWISEMKISSGTGIAEDADKPVGQASASAASVSAMGTTGAGAAGANKGMTLTITLRAAKDAGVDGVTQMKPIPELLSSELGIPLRTTAQIQDVSENNHPVRQIRLKGEFQ